MSRGEAFGLKKYIKIIHLKNLSYFENFNEKKFGLLTEVWVEHFAREAELLAS